MVSLTFISYIKLIPSRSDRKMSKEGWGGGWVGREGGLGGIKVTEMGLSSNATIFKKRNLRPEIQYHFQLKESLLSHFVYSPCPINLRNAYYTQEYIEGFHTVPYFST